jgi:hypothetical protein
VRQTLSRVVHTSIISDNIGHGMHTLGSKATLSHGNTCPHTQCTDQLVALPFSAQVMDRIECVLTGPWARDTLPRMHDSAKDYYSIRVRRSFLGTRR